LAAEIIDSNYDGVKRRCMSGKNTSESAIRDPNTGEIHRRLGIHLAKTKRRRILNGKTTNRCNECKLMKSSNICSACLDDTGNPKNFFICEPEKGKVYWDDHISKFHY
jgi:hypothetical protein